jgi:hypothetical protein
MGIQRYIGAREMGKQEKVLPTWEGMRWGFRGKTGLGERDHALQLFCRHLLLFSSSAFGIAGCWTAVTVGREFL